MNQPHPDDSPLIAARAWAAKYPRLAAVRQGKYLAPLDLSPPAITAHERRQEILIAHDKWPVQHWYNDEDFCRAFNTARGMADRIRDMEAQIECLQATMERLPKCWRLDESGTLVQDVPIAPGITVFGRGIFGGTVHAVYHGLQRVDVQIYGAVLSRSSDQLYTSREALEAARKNHGDTEEKTV